MTPAAAGKRSFDVVVGVCSSIVRAMVYSNDEAMVTVAEK
jgi:hypothetical protein